MRSQTDSSAADAAERARRARSSSPALVRIRSQDHSACTYRQRRTMTAVWGPPRRTSGPIVNAPFPCGNLSAWVLGSQKLALYSASVFVFETGGSSGSSISPSSVEITAISLPRDLGVNVPRNPVAGEATNDLVTGVSVPPPAVLLRRTAAVSPANTHRDPCPRGIPRRRSRP